MIFVYNDVSLHYEILGEGKPVVLLHGLNCDHRLMKGCFEPIFQSLSNYQRIYVDLPGMGQSKGNVDYATADHIREVLIHFLLNTIQENFIIIGESYGGYLTRGIIASLYNRIDGMMLLCPVVVPEHRLRKVPISTIKKYDETYLNTLTEKARRMFQRFAIVANKYTHERYVLEIEAGAQLADRTYCEHLEQHYAFSFDVDAKLHAIQYQKPTLFLCGRQDSCVGYQDLWKQLEDFPRASMSVLDVAGHNLQLEQVDVFQALTINWLQRIDQE